MHTSSRLRRTIATLAASLLLASGTVVAAAPAHAAPPPPTVMAALGDSISQAAMTCSSLVSCPTNTWSTGTASSVNSHLARLRPSSPGLVAYNNSVSGAASAALPGQANKAVSQRAQYVTIEIGANDACTKTVAKMTTTATFKANVKTALSALAASPAAPEIFVASIPSLQRLYDLNKSSASARLAWVLLQTCQSMLASPTSTKVADVQRRAAVQQRVNEFNQALAQVCAETPKCRFDGMAVANYAFTKSDVSTRDYFHPSLTGQTTLAALTWPLTQWAS